MHEHTIPSISLIFLLASHVEKNDSLHLLQKFKQKNVIYKNHQPMVVKRRFFEAFCTWSTQAVDQCFPTWGSIKMLKRLGAT